MNRRRSVAILATLVACSLPLYASAGTLPSACGAASAQYKVKTTKDMPLADTESSATGRIVFVESLNGAFDSGPVVRFAVDSHWLGADKGASYFAENVTPGRHTVCASREGSSKEEKSNVAVGTVIVKPGQTSFVDFTITRTPIGPAASHAAGQMLGYATPDMTAKLNDTYDTAAMEDLSATEGMETVKRLPRSKSTPK